METTLNDSNVPLKEGGAVTMNLSAAPRPPDRCNTTKEDFLANVETTKEHIRAGDVFQLVLSQRFERSTYADPFDIYRSLRIVNPSPYMVYLQVSFPSRVQRRVVLHSAGACYHGLLLMHARMHEKGQCMLQQHEH
jgi:anthranilate/para-aminobenzoate synthase component I